MKANRLLLGAIFASAIGVAMVMLAKESSVAQQIARAIQLPIQGDFPSLGGATGWRNSKPLSPPDLRGKVVLVDFWTYTCINWRRQLPYVRAWAEKYNGSGRVGSVQLQSHKVASATRRPV